MGTRKITGTLFGRRLRPIGYVAMIIGSIAACQSEMDESSVQSAQECNFAEAEDIYRRYVLDVMENPQDQSCVDCHDGKFDLTTYHKETSCHTMACLVEQQLVSLDSPEESQILEFIRMAGAPEDDPRVKRELEGFSAWIEYSAGCHETACGVIENPCDYEPVESTTGSGASGGSGGAGAGGTGSGGAGNNCDPADLLPLFEEKVFAYIGGCAACHSPTGKTPGEENAGLWINESDSFITLMDIIGANGFDGNDPAQGEFLTKPLPEGAVVPSKIGDIVGVEHGGGPKLTPGAPMFQERFDDIVDFEEAYAAWFQACGF